MKFSVIMPSLLENYPGAAPDRNKLFIRAVDSFLRQSHPDKELIVISDGCIATIDILEKKYNQHLESGLIKLVKLPRHPLFTGAVRQAGIDIATGDGLCNLDSDDILLPHHLSNIAVVWDSKKHQWAFFNHITKPDNIKMDEFYTDVKPELGSIGNGNIVWRRDLDVTWNNCDGKQDNQLFIAQLIEKYPNPQKIYGAGYIIAHVQIKKIDL